MSQYADLARLMKATPMGAGTVLDNTIDLRHQRRRRAS